MGYGYGKGRTENETTKNVRIQGLILESLLSSLIYVISEDTYRSM